MTEEKDLLNTDIDKLVSEQVTITDRQGKKIKAKVKALEGVYCKVLTSLASKIYGFTSDNLDDLIKQQTQLFEVCLKYGYEQLVDNNYESISSDRIKEIIAKDFKYAQAVYMLVQALTLKLNEQQVEQKKKV